MSLTSVPQAPKFRVRGASQAGGEHAVAFVTAQEPCTLGNSQYDKGTGGKAAQPLP